MAASNFGRQKRNFKTHASGYENPGKTWLRAILAAKSATLKHAPGVTFGRLVGF